MDAFKKLHLAAAQEESLCGLKHDGSPPEAVNTIITPMGFTQNQPVDEHTICVCQECIESLASGMWILFYCLGCNSSAWRVIGRNDYFDNDVIQYINYCPDCVNK